MKPLSYFDFYKPETFSWNDGFGWEAFCELNKLIFFNLY